VNRSPGLLALSGIGCLLERRISPLEKVVDAAILRPLACSATRRVGRDEAAATVLAIHPLAEQRDTNVQHPSAHRATLMERNPGTERLCHGITIERSEDPC
jgi:hypothetical protein